MGGREERKSLKMGREEDWETWKTGRQKSGKGVSSYLAFFPSSHLAFF
jgi:hypothetical protein